MRNFFSWLIISTLVFFGLHILSVKRAYSDSNVYVNEDAQYIYAGNQYLELTFQKSDGKLYGIKHKLTNTDFIKEKNAWWSLYDFVYYENDQPHYINGGASNLFTYNSRTIAEGVALDLYWNSFTVDGTPLNVDVHVTIEVKDDSPLSNWTISIINNENITIEAINFPSISGLGQISLDPELDFLVYPSMSGLLFQNPLSNFVTDRGWGWELYYPSAYSTMQFIGYYGISPAAGLYIAAYDRDGNSKYFDFSKPNLSWLHTKIAHIPEFGEGSGYLSGYSSIIGVFSGDWYDAAQIYRSWALHQPWASQGPLATRSDIPAWYSSAGIRQWIYTHPGCLTDANPFSIVPEVMNDTATYLGHAAIASWVGWERHGWYLEYPEVFPPKEGWDPFRQAIRTTHESENRIHFIANTTSYSSYTSSWSGAEPYACRDRFGNYFDPNSFSECGVTTTFYRMCPATSFWQGKLNFLLSTMAQEGADVIQLDGFPIFGPQPCVDPAHAHPKGGGAWWYNNYRQIFSDFKIGARQTNPDLILSSEGMAENYIPLVDNFQDPFTTGWSPNSVISSFQEPLKVQLIPLWHAVYHDYAFLDSGIGFFSRNAPTGAIGYGDYRDFYVRGFGLALIWGEMPDTWYADEKISSLNEQAERDMANYLRRIVDARTGYAQQYLVYGRMLKPPALNVPLFRINGAQNIPYSHDNYPAFDSPAVLSSVWMAPSGEVGYIFTNISGQSVTFNITISPSEISLPSSGPYDVIQNRNGSQSSLFTGVNLPQTLSIQIGPLDVLLIEVVFSQFPGDFAPADCDVDGSDLAVLIANMSLLDIATFADNFGNNTCP